LNVNVVELEADKLQASAGGKSGKDAKPAEAALAKSVLGLAVADLSAEQKRELKLQGGVLVQDVDGPAEAAGMKAGDVVLQAANVQVGDVKQFEAVLARIDRKRTLPLLVRRSDSTGYVVIRPSAK